MEVNCTKYVLIILAMLASNGYGQSAFDPNCYFPLLNDGIDTVYGGSNEQALGGDLRLIPVTSEDSGRIILRGLPPQLPFLSVLDDQPPIDLPSLTKSQIRKKFGINIGLYDNAIFGYFRDTKHIDVLIGSQYFYIYWADDEGNFDTSRRTLLSGSFKGDLGGGTGAFFDRPYVADLTSDSLLDIVAGYSINWNLPNDSFDSVWLMMWKGGQHLFEKGDIASQDSALFIDTLAGAKIFLNWVSQGDFRGTGREDLIVIDDSNSWFYYENDPPFSLEKLFNSISHDTLLSAFENSKFGYIRNRNVGGGIIHDFRVVSKPEWDISDDIVVRIPTLGDPTFKNQKIYIFQGGLNFPKERLTLISPTDTILTPYHYDNNFQEVSWGHDIRLIGDMTGTGNPVLYTTAGTAAFYVMGKALDDKIDMYYPGFSEYQQGSAIGDVIGIHSNWDNYTDVLLTYPRVLSEKDWLKGWTDVGTIHLIKGSNKIPVNLNPKYSVEDEQANSILSIHPNPASQSITVISELDGPGVIHLYDVMGRSFGDWIHTAGSTRLDISSMPAGCYWIELKSNKSRMLKKVFIVH